jgi:hypothetical protein
MSKETTMKEQSQDRHEQASGAAEGARRATGATADGTAGGPLGPGQRWSIARKREATLRLLRGESLEALSRELGVEMYRLEAWRDRAYAGIDASRCSRRRRCAPRFRARATRPAVCSAAFTQL